MRIGFETGRTRAHGHVVFGQADGVATATVGDADGNALVIRLVARRRRRAVTVGQALDLATPGVARRIAGVKTGRTLTFGGVVLGGADGVLAAVD